MGKATYTLEGREWKGTGDDGSAPCIFCGKAIEHINAGGIGLCCMALVDGKTTAFLYCHEGQCDARKADTEAHPDFGSIWRCGCEPDYIEVIGDVCPYCKHTQAEPTPYPCCHCDERITDHTAKAHYEEHEAVDRPLSDRQKAAVLDRIVAVIRHRRGKPEADGRGWSHDKATERDLEAYDEIVGILNEDEIDLI